MCLPLNSNYDPSSSHHRVIAEPASRCHAVLFGQAGREAPDIDPRPQMADGRPLGPGLQWTPADGLTPLTADCPAREAVCLSAGLCLPAACFNGILPCSSHWSLSVCWSSSHACRPPGMGLFYAVSRFNKVYNVTQNLRELQITLMTPLNLTPIIKHGH